MSRRTFPFILLVLVITVVDSVSKLDEVYENCQVERPKHFCLGAKANETAFPEGRGCLKDKDCEAIVYAIQLDVPDNKNRSIRIVMVLPRTTTPTQGLFSFSKTRSELKFDTRKSKILMPPNVLIVGSAIKYTDDNSEDKILPPDFEGGYLQESEVEIDKPPMIIYKFLAPSVINYPPIKYSVDLINDQLFPTLTMSHLESSSYKIITSKNQPDAVKIFARGGTTPTTTTGTIIQATKSSGSSLTTGHGSGIITLMVTLAITLAIN